jgi:hypothetical protein
LGGACGRRISGQANTAWAFAGDRGGVRRFRLPDGPAAYTE